MEKISICIISYNQMNLIETAIKSVLKQKYKNIELIILDDGSIDFDYDKVENIIIENNVSNYDYQIIHNEKNLGTVKNMNNGICKSSGDYILFFAADDKICDENVCLRLKKQFESSDINIVTRKSVECDYNLNPKEKNKIDFSRHLLFNNMSSYEQYVSLCQGCIFSSGATMYRNSFLKKEKFSESYKIVEDWPSWLNFTRKGNKIKFANFDVLFHREGGVSSQNSKSKSTIVKMYRKDMLKIYIKEIVAHFFFLKRKDRITFLKNIKDKMFHKNNKDLNKLHMFVICAYKEEPFLDSCIKSLKSQTVKSRIIVSTSTPNKMIENICKRNKVKLVVNNGNRGHIEDFCFAYSLANTKYVTLCHQDDIYYPDFAEKIVKKMEKTKKPIIGFSNYNELRGGKTVKKNKLLIVKRILNFPLLVLGKFRFGRMINLSLGNAICAPSVTYNKELVDIPVIKSNFKANIDWDTWIELAKKNGCFVYCNKALLEHRIHEGSTTTSVINNNVMKEEDIIIFRRFWPEFIAKILCKIYATSEKSNQLKK